MLFIKKNVSLKTYNTFNINVISKGFLSITNFEELKEAIEKNPFKSYRILGGGSNTLFTNNYEGLTLHIANKGISVFKESDKDVIVGVEAGENWHDFVLWCLNKNFGGVENLSLIPGNVGAAPIQNIGAYGVELKDVFYSCEAMNSLTKEIRTFYVDDCQFNYRSSIFKTSKKNRYIILKVYLKLQKPPHNYNTEYGPILKGLDSNKLSIMNIAKTIISIRKSKLPNPKKLGNSGSFFKNPIVSVKKYESLKNKFSEIPGYKIKSNQIKIPAGWLIEFIGYKGYKIGEAGVYNKQALVLVNHGDATGKNILSLAKKIQKDIRDKFNISLEFEVNIL